MKKPNPKSFKEVLVDFANKASLFQIHIMDDMKQRAKGVCIEVGYPRQEEFLEYLDSLKTIEQIKECISHLMSWYMGELAIATVKRVKDEINKKEGLKNE